MSLRYKELVKVSTTTSWVRQNGIYFERVSDTETKVTFNEEQVTDNDGVLSTRGINNNPLKITIDGTNALTEIKIFDKLGNRTGKITLGELVDALNSAYLVFAYERDNPPPPVEPPPVDPPVEPIV